MHIASVGLVGQVGRFRSVDRIRYERGAQVICRTSRGLELGSILAPVSGEGGQGDGDVLRKVTQDDRLILTRIERFRDRAFNACSRLITERGLDATLVDVEHLFDGQNVYFYFLGEVSEELDALTGQLAEEYEAKVKFRKFAETLANGCGPDCGSGLGSSCGDGNCTSCALKSSCRTT